VLHISSLIITINTPDYYIIYHHIILHYTILYPSGDEIFRTCRDRPWGPPSLLYNGYWVFPSGRGGRGMGLTPTPM